MFGHELRDLYSAVKQLVAALPRFTDTARQPELTTVLREDLQKTWEHARTPDGRGDRGGAGAA